MREERWVVVCGGARKKGLTSDRHEGRREGPGNHPFGCPRKKESERGSLFDTADVMETRVEFVSFILGRYGGPEGSVHGSVRRQQRVCVCVLGRHRDLEGVCAAASHVVLLEHNHFISRLGGSMKGSDERPDYRGLWTHLCEEGSAVQRAHS